MTKTANARPFDVPGSRILNEEAKRTGGEAALSSTVTVGTVLGDLVRSTIGPLGMDKMIVDDRGDVVVSNAGTTILEELDLAHPAAEIVLEGARSQRDDVGDGSTSVVILCGELLSNAAGLIENGLHPQTIISGYRRAAASIAETIHDRAIAVDPSDDELLSAVGHTAMNGGILVEKKRRIAEIAVRAVRAVVRDGAPDLEYLGTEAIAGDVFTASRLVDGVVVNRDAVHPAMPTRIEDATIALLDFPIETDEPVQSTRATVSRPDQLSRFRDREDEQLVDVAERIVSTGADVIVTEQSIDDRVQLVLAENGILGLRRATNTDLDHLASATGAQRTGTLDELDDSRLGRAGLVEQRTIGDKERYVVEDCENPESVTLVVRGGTTQVAESTARVIEGTFEAIALAIETGSVLPGGGATEVQLALEVRERAEGVPGREQLAMRAFADALEVVPRTLAETSGRNPVDTVIELRSRHAAGEANAGLNAIGGEIGDMVERGVVEPTAAREQVIARALDVATTLLRIDEIVVAPDEVERQLPDTTAMDEHPRL